MADQYTPTTEEIREYIELADRVTAHMFSPDAPDAAEAFDRWLAAHDAQVRAEERDRLMSEIGLEYAVMATGDDEPWSDISSSLDYITDSTGGVVDANDVLVQRRSAGAWHPITNQQNSLEEA